MDQLLKGQRLTPFETAKLLFHLPSLFRLLGRLIFDRQVAPLAKALFVGALLFIISPFDIPNYVPVLGELSDIALALMACRWFINFCPPEVVAAHIASIRGRLGQMAQVTEPAYHADLYHADLNAQ